MSYYTSPEYLRIKDFWKEPDLWEAEIEGYFCCARRNNAKAWCGYVRVPVEHPMIPNDNLDCHGGITWSQSMAPWMSEEDKGWFWYGFDCSHYLDLTPEQVFKSTIERDDFYSDYTYRTLEYVKQNVTELAHQLKAFEEVSSHA